MDVLVSPNSEQYANAGRTGTWLELDSILCDSASRLKPRVISYSRIKYNIRKFRRCFTIAHSISSKKLSGGHKNLRRVNHVEKSAFLIYAKNSNLSPDLNKGSELKDLTLS